MKITFYNSLTNSLEEFKTVKPNEDDNILETYRQKRANVLYSEDERQVIRQSHNNKDIQKLYKDFLGEPGSELAEELCHTSYNAKREKYPDNK